MIKRTAATTFLLLAGLLFLGHAVVPHHHHGNLICFAQSHCKAEDSAGDHESGPDNHHHDGEGGDGHCVLKDPVVVSSNQLNEVLKIFNNKTSQPWNYNLIPGMLANETETKAQPPEPEHSLRCLAVFHLYASLSSASLGLRAPPSV